MSFNQSHGHSLANRRRELNELLAVVAMEYLNTVPDLTPAEKQLLWDLRRPGSERGTRVFTQLLNIAPRCSNPHSLSEVLRQQVLIRVPHPTLCPIDSFLNETRAQAAADVAQAQFITERTPTRRDSALEKLSQHEAAIRVALDALHLWPSQRSA